MESLLGLATALWDHEPVWVPLSVQSSAFRRPEAAKAGTPNTRFMESPLELVAVHWDHEPRGTSKAPQRAHSKTWRMFGPRSQRASVLECGGAPPLSAGSGVGTHCSWSVNRSAGGRRRR